MASNIDLTNHLKQRVVDLYELKKQGKKIVGYFPGDWVPEELILASGAIPVCLVHGGTTEPVEAASYAATRLLCPFSKTVIGLWTLEQPYYRLVDFVVGPISCNHLRRTTDMWYYYTDTEIFYLGVPHEHAADHALAYYLESLVALKERLEQLTGQKIDDERLRQAIGLCNEMRSHFKKISELRKNDFPSVRCSEFVQLNHGSYYADPLFMLDHLKSFYNEAKDRKKEEKSSRARILLTGPNLAMGDTKVVSIVENLGADIVVEEICEGIRFYWENVLPEGNLMENIARKYLVNRVPCAFQGQGTRERMDFLRKLATDYKVDGVIWYQLRYCETYNVEYHYVHGNFQKMGIPIMKIESEYDPSDHGQISTRIEAFLEIADRRGGHVQ